MPAFTRPTNEQAKQMLEIRVTLSIPALETLLSTESGKSDQILTLLRQIMQAQAVLANEENLIMTTLQDVQTAVTAEDTVVDSAMALITGLAAQVAALAPNQAAIDALAADITAKSSALAAAVTANTATPVVPPPVTPPTTTPGI